MSASPMPSSPGQRGPSEILEETLLAVPGLRALIAMTDEGEILSFAGADAEALRPLASFAKGAIDLAERLATDSGCGALSSVMIDASQGRLAIHRIDNQRVLFAFTDERATMGTMAHDLSWCAQQLARQ